MFLSMLVSTIAFASNLGVTTGESYETPSNVTKIETDYGLSINAQNLKDFIIGSGVEKVGFSVFSPTYNKVANIETVTMEDVEVIDEFAFRGLITGYVEL